MKSSCCYAKTWVCTYTLLHTIRVITAFNCSIKQKLQLKWHKCIFTFAAVAVFWCVETRKTSTNLAQFCIFFFQSPLHRPACHSSTALPAIPPQTCFIQLSTLVSIITHQNGSHPIISLYHFKVTHVQPHQKLVLSKNKNFCRLYQSWSVNLIVKNN